MASGGCLERIPDLAELRKELTELVRREHILRRLIEIVERRDKWSAEDCSTAADGNGGAE